jgi:hypothetical protein
MSQSKVEEKYGVKSSDEKVRNYHASRRMFVIKGGDLIMAEKGIEDSHAQWFKKMGWMNEDDMSFMDRVTRGYVDSSGVYFYKGYNFDVDKESKEEIMSHLQDLVEQLSIDPSLHLFGGKIKQEQAGDWPPERDFGEISELI